MNETVKVTIVGTRGIPARYGGFETFAEEISELLSKEGFDISVQCDRSNGPAPDKHGNVKLYYTPCTKTDNPLKYYYYGIKWGLRNSDIILVTGTGGSIFYFLRFFYNKILITNTDGLESGRSKWSWPKRLYVKLSEILAVWFSDLLIADSKAISEYLTIRYRSFSRKVKVIEYGAYINKEFDDEILKKYNLVHDEYYLVVSRLEPENNLIMIVEGYLESGSEFPIIIVGPVKNDNYSLYLTKKYKSEKIRFTGGIYDAHELKVLRYSCKAYIHGHSVGGTNPSLLEAMASGNIIICHDNVFNHEVTSSDQFYFKDAKGVANCINLVESISVENKINLKNKSISRIESHYNWNNILEKYSGLFRNCIHNNKTV